MSANVAGKELLAVLGDVKASVQDKLGIVDFPIPQFILIGKQSVGKSRLIEALAGEQFNFTSGTLGSRRPTVLEFRNVPGLESSRWWVRNRTTNAWSQHPVLEVMKIIGDAHNELGETVTDIPVWVRIESPSCVDMQIVDLPGFRDFAVDPAKQQLSKRIEEMVMNFMKDKRNVMLCVEQASDAANMSTLAKCRDQDPRLERTILIRNKLDKYYNDLTAGNVNNWVDGFGDIPKGLMRFALTLPFSSDGDTVPNFAGMRAEMSKKDVAKMRELSLGGKFMEGIGFENFAKFMEKKIEALFVDAIGPVMTNLKNLQEERQKRDSDLKTEVQETDPHRILHTTRDCGASFATALTHVMEGVLQLTEGRMTLEQELREFEAHHKALGSSNFTMLPSEDFCNLDDYIDYLRDEARVGACDVEVNGGAQFRRLMTEVEIFLRFSEIAVETKKRDVIQARGVALSSLEWRDVVAKLLSNEAHLPLQQRVLYVGERLRWFFERQKEAVLEFMDTLEGTPKGSMFSALYPKHVKLIKNNEMIRHLVYQTYDATCQRQLQLFVELFDNVLTSTFANPWVFLKGATTGDEDLMQDTQLPSFEDTKDRIPQEIAGRSGIETKLSSWLSEIPMEPEQIDTAVDKVQMLLTRAYGFIRSQVCDQVELFAESFFKLPMLRRLEEDMSLMDLSEEDKANYQARRARLDDELSKNQVYLTEVTKCVDRLQGFIIQSGARGSV